MEGESVALQFDAMDWENVHSKNLELLADEIFSAEIVIYLQQGENMHLPAALVKPSYPPGPYALKYGRIFHICS